MPNIVHRIGFEGVPPQQLYKAVSTAKGFAAWWTVRTEGKPRIGSIFKFRFSNQNSGPDFEVLELAPGKKAAFKCIRGPGEWVDTKLEFEIRRESGESILLFRHSGWREEVEFMHHCSVQWAYFLIGFRNCWRAGKDARTAAIFSLSADGQSSRRPSEEATNS